MDVSDKQPLPPGILLYILSPLTAVDFFIWCLLCLGAIIPIVCATTLSEVVLSLREGFPSLRRVVLAVGIGGAVYRFLRDDDGGIGGACPPPATAGLDIIFVSSLPFLYTRSDSKRRGKLLIPGNRCYSHILFLQLDVASKTLQIYI